MRFTRLLCMGACLLTALVCRADSLEEGFRNPPNSAKPHTWWHWVNDNISKEGITADLEAMKRVGVGGVQIFNVDVGVPSGGITFMSERWREMMVHAAAYKAGGTSREQVLRRGLRVDRMGTHAVSAGSRTTFGTV